MFTGEYRFAAALGLVVYAALVVARFANRQAFEHQRALGWRDVLRSRPGGEAFGAWEVIFIRIGRMINCEKHSAGGWQGATIFAMHARQAQRAVVEF